jgi:hypothetical protein
MLRGDIVKGAESPVFSRHARFCDSGSDSRHGAGIGIPSCSPICKRNSPRPRRTRTAFGNRCMASRAFGWKTIGRTITMYHIWDIISPHRAFLKAARGSVLMNLVHANWAENARTNRSRSLPSAWPGSVARPVPRKRPRRGPNHDTARRSAERIIFLDIHFMSVYK